MPFLRLFGPVALAGVDGRALPAAASQPKRIALLAYLAVARPPGLRTRDQLLALFWPEADAAHARNSLSQALHVLRRSLGEDAVVIRGDQVGLDPERLECDVVRFRSLLDAGRLEDALDLYGGAFLEGFHADAAPEFDSWMEEERGGLRAQAFAAGKSLAQRAEAVGEARQSIHWTRRALEILPYDEHTVRRLITLQAGIGDRSGALASYERFAERLTRELELEPSPVTRALAAAIPTMPASLALEEPSPPGFVSSKASADALSTVPPPARERQPARAPLPVEALAASNPLPRRRLSRRWLVGLPLAALVSLGALSAWLARPSPPHTRTLAVLPFCVAGDTGHEHWGADVAALLAVALDGAGGWRAGDENALIASAARRRLDCRDAERAGALAAELQAGRHVLGTLVRTTGGLRADAWVYDTRGRMQGARSHTTRDPADLLALVDGLARELAPVISGVPGEPARVAVRTTTSLVALKAYLEGEEQLRAGEWRRAIESFERAVAADSGFALAWFRLSVAHDQRGEASEPVQSAAEHAGRFAAVLPGREQVLLRAWTARAHGRAAEAMEGFRAYIGDNPGDVFALSSLADLEYHYGPLFGRRSSAARATFERVLALDPLNDDALNHLGAIAREEGRHLAADSLRARWMAAHPEAELALTAQVEHAFRYGDARAREEAVRAVRASSDLIVLFAPSWASWVGSSEGEATLTRLGTEPIRAAPVRARSHVRLAMLALRSGRRMEAREALLNAGRVDPSTELRYSAWLAALPTFESARGELEALQARLRADTAVAAVERGLWASPESGMDRHLRLYLLGLLSVRLGRSADAVAYADSVASLSGPAQAPLLGPNLGHGVRALLAWSRQDVTGTVREVEAIQPVMSFTLAERSPFASHVLERFLRAEALRALGRPDEALGWYESLNSAGSAALSATRRLRAAEIHERAGRRREAAEHYGWIVTAWSRCDPDSRRALVEAQRGLERVEGRRDVRVVRPIE